MHALVYIRVELATKKNSSLSYRFFFFLIQAYFLCSCRLCYLSPHCLPTQTLLSLSGRSSPEFSLCLISAMGMEPSPCPSSSSSSSRLSLGPSLSPRDALLERSVDGDGVTGPSPPGVSEYSCGALSLLQDRPVHRAHQPLGASSPPRPDSLRLPPHPLQTQSPAVRQSSRQYRIHCAQPSNTASKVDCVGMSHTLGMFASLRRTLSKNKKRK